MELAKGKQQYFQMALNIEDLISAQSSILKATNIQDDVFTKTTLSEETSHDQNFGLGEKSSPKQGHHFDLSDIDRTLPNKLVGSTA